MARGRPCNIKMMVRGQLIHDFITEQLIYKSYRELIKDKLFVALTGIKSVGNLYNFCNANGIDVLHIYEYAKGNKLLKQKNITYEDFYYNKTGRYPDIQSIRKVTELDVIEDIARTIGLNMEVKNIGKEVSIMTILDFISQDRYDKLYEISSYKVGYKEG